MYPGTCSGDRDHGSREGMHLNFHDLALYIHPIFVSPSYKVHLDPISSHVSWYNYARLYEKGCNALLLLEHLLLLQTLLCYLFLLFDDVSSTGKRILFWMSPTFLAAWLIIIRSVRIMFIDGTFKITTSKMYSLGIAQPLKD